MKGRHQLPSPVVITFIATIIKFYLNGFTDILNFNTAGEILLSVDSF